MLNTWKNKWKLEQNQPKFEKCFLKVEIVIVKGTKYNILSICSYSQYAKIIDEEVNWSSLLRHDIDIFFYS